MPCLVQSRCALVSSVLLFFASLSLAEEKPEARDILATVRVAQSAQDRVLTGRLRVGPNRTPFTLTTHAGTVRWDFQNPPQSIVLQMGEKSAVLEEVTPDGKRKISGSKLDDPVRGTGITFEDLSLRFLYWQRATVEGEQTIALTKCWQLLVQPPAPGASSYSKVRVWVSKENGALLKCEAYGPDDRLQKTFRVVSGQKSRDGLWILKQMRIEAAAGSRSDPTYLEIDPEK